jgi:hypothetical protein
MKKCYILRYILIIIVMSIFYLPASGLAAAETKLDFNVIVGEWVRPDGGYIISVQNVQSDGSVDVGYFNPGKINVAEAEISQRKGLVKLFVKLQDKGYPGSTYTLYYYTEKDALAGFYYQAAVKQTYEVIFFRKK